MKFPQKFVERIQELLPEGEWEDFFRTATEPLPRTVRTVPGFVAPQGWTLTPASGMQDTSFLIRQNQKEIPLGKTLPHWCGEIYAASLSSLLPPMVLSPQPGDTVLDVCAAPGSKATALAQMMQNEGTLVVNEMSSTRSKKLAANLDRMGVQNAVTLQYDAGGLASLFGQQFDCVLLDAPCSSEGYGRKSSTFYQTQWSEKSIHHAARLQKRLIIAAFQVLAPGGTLVYSTCTSAPEENEQVVQHLKDEYREAVEILPVELPGVPTRAGVAEFQGKKVDPDIAQNCRRVWPHDGNKTWDSELFFICKIRKIAPLSLPSPEKLSQKNPPTLLGKNQTAEIITRLCKAFGIPREIFKGKALIKRGGAVSLTTKSAAKWAIRNPHRRVGLPLLDADGNITTPFSVQFGSHAIQNVLDLTPGQCAQWLAGTDLRFATPLPSPNGTEILVRYEKHCLGHGKVMEAGEKLKNKLSRSLVMELSFIDINPKEE